MQNISTKNYKSPAHENSFDFLRLFAATCVLFSHSFALVGALDPLTHIGWSFGQVGLTMFFAISGFLVTASWHRDESVKHFLLKRSLRLLPALYVLVLIAALVVAPFFSNLGIAGYFRSFGFLQYILLNSFLITPYNSLPGVFSHNEFPGVINGALWSLPVEFFAYCSVLIVSFFTRKLVYQIKKIKLVLSGTLLLISSFLLNVHDLSGYFFPVNIVLLYLGVFWFGSWLYEWRDVVHTTSISKALMLKVAVVLVVTVLAVQLKFFFLSTILIALLLSSGSIIFAYRQPKFGKIAALGDASYGIYLYGFLIQQILIVCFQQKIEPLLLFAFSLPVSYLLGLLSWRFVEKPALRFKRRI